jgi:hypothetical protein
MVFTYLIWNVFAVAYSIFYIVLWHSTILCYCFSSVYCIVFLVLYCLLVMYVLLPWLRFIRAIPWVVRQLTGYNSQRRGTARTSKLVLNLLTVMYVLFSVFCVLFVRKWMCTVLLPAGVNPIAVLYNIIYIYIYIYISYLTTTANHSQSGRLTL